MKQETIEEAAERISDKCKLDTHEVSPFINGFIECAKWQQEQDKNKYSEEEIRKALLDIVLVNPAHISLLKSGYGQFPDTFELTEKGVDYVLEQFKKK
jgi:hypothetical protein